MVGRLKRRRDFLAAAKGRKAARRAFVVEVRQRDDDDEPRFGFTVSKRVARSAVVRNRIRRRLKEAVRLTADEEARRGHDYVVVGRRAALREPFSELTSALHGAMRQIRSDRDDTRQGA
jgi:ribonuclease P protein component